MPSPHNSRASWLISPQVPVGVPGRMWIAGPTLAIGYLNMPERTAERFVPDPFAKAAGREGERMYDTGDRCRYLPSGSIEVIGRCDFMVKVSEGTPPRLWFAVVIVGAAVAGVAVSVVVAAWAAAVVAAAAATVGLELASELLGVW